MMGQHIRGRRTISRLRGAPLDGSCEDEMRKLRRNELLITTWRCTWL
jgi:hypothetical protein